MSAAPSPKVTRRPVSIYSQLTEDDRAALLAICARLLMSRRREGLKPRIERTITLGWRDDGGGQWVGAAVYAYIDKADIAVVVDSIDGILLAQSLPGAYESIDPKAKTGGAP
jgi:hypothetical protein